jgi:hypothetical protein
MPTLEIVRKVTVDVDGFWTMAPDGTRIGLPCKDAAIRVFAIPEGRQVSEVNPRAAHVNQVVMGANGLLAAVVDDVFVRVWRMEECA